MDSIKLFNQNGNSLLQVILASGLMGLVALGLASMMANQNKEVGALEEKMMLIGLQTQVMNVLSSPAFCECFIGTNTLNYGADPKVWNGLPSTLGSSYDGTCAPVGGAILSVGVPISVKIVPIALNIMNITETTTGSGIFSGNLMIQFNQNLLTRYRKNLLIPIYFSVNMADPVGARRLVSCSSLSSAQINLPVLCGQMNGFYNGTSCEPTYQ